MLPRKSTLKQFKKLMKKSKKSKTNTDYGATDTSKKKISTYENKIKNFTEFLNENKNDYEFKIGDVVIVDTLIRSVKNSIFIITDMSNTLNNKYRILDLGDDNIDFWEAEGNLRKATKEEIEDWTIKRKAKKYNL